MSCLGGKRATIFDPRALMRAVIAATLAYSLLVVMLIVANSSDAAVALARGHRDHQARRITARSRLNRPEPSRTADERHDLTQEAGARTRLPRSVPRRSLGRDPGHLLDLHRGLPSHLVPGRFAGH